MHNDSPIELKTSTPVWDAKNGRFAFINAVGFTSLTFKSNYYPVAAALEYKQPIAGGQSLRINGRAIPINQAGGSTTWISLIWLTWGNENLIILSGDENGVSPVNLQTDKVPVDYAYATTLTVSYNEGKPNINVTDVSGSVDFALTGTVLGAAGLITFQQINELAAINFTNGKAEGNHNYILGTGEEILISYIHTNAGLKFYCANPNPVI